MKNRFLPLILIAVLGVGVYANSLKGEFIRDDNVLIRDNTYIKSWPGILKCFYQDIAAGAGQEWNSYRPLQMAAYMVDYKLWGLNPAGYHLSSVVLHILAALLIYWLIILLYDNKRVAFLAGLFFVIHPIHTEAVTYISGRADSLSAVFILLCFIFYIKYPYHKRAVFYPLIILTYAFALFSRENTVIFPALLLLYHYCFRKKLRKGLFFSLCAVSAGYILLRMTLLGGLLSNISYVSTFFQRIPGFFAAFAGYLKLLFVPVPLHTSYGLKLFSFSDPGVIAGILALVLLLAGAFKFKKHRRIIFFPVMWFLIWLLPHSNLYPINAYMAEHWLYIPSIGFFVLAGAGLSHALNIKRLKGLVLVLIAVLTGFYSYLTIRQNRFWHEPVSFHKWALKYAPDDFKEHLLLGTAYYERGRYQEALSSYDKALGLAPEEAAKIYYNIGLVYRDTNQPDKAVAAFNKSIEIKPQIRVWRGLAKVYKDMGKSEQAAGAYKKVIELEPQKADNYYELGALYASLGSYKQAEDLFRQAIAVDAEFAPAYNDLGTIYMILGRYQQAVFAFNKAIALEPQAGSYYNLALVYFYQKEYKQAVNYCDKALEMGFKADTRFLNDLKPYRSQP